MPHPITTGHGEHAFWPSSRSAVPFEEDDANPQIWYLDHNFLENMQAMFRKINGISATHFQWGSCPLK